MKITMQQAEILLVDAENAAFGSPKPSNFELGSLYEQAAFAWLSALQQAGVNLSSENNMNMFRDKVLASYNKAASYFLDAISETSDFYGSIDKYLSVEVSACTANFVLNKNLDIEPVLIANLMKIDALLKTSIEPYAAGELLLEYAEKASGDNGHYGLANALYELAVTHFNTAIQDNKIAPNTKELYKKALSGWLKVTNLLLDTAKGLNNELRMDQYNLQKSAITKSIAEIPPVAIKKSFLDTEHDDRLDNVTPTSKSNIKRRTRPT